jgi:predicted regulator of amino acid metabolism with ACT domain
MKVSERTIRFLGKTLCGDNELLPYKSGSQLVDFFVEFGSDDRYGEGFPSRWRYTEDKVRQYNDTPELKDILENSVDLRVLTDAGMDGEKLEESVTHINSYLATDGYELKNVNGYFKVHDSKGIIVQPTTVKSLSHDFIQDSIEKCHSKIETGDFKGAITNARSLAEAVMIEIIVSHEGKEVKNDGNLLNLYKRVKKILKLKNDPRIMSDQVIQILTGLNSITTGLAGLSNSSSDRHASKVSTKKHHAQLAVNATMTLVDFLLDSREYQSKRAFTVSG